MKLNTAPRPIHTHEGAVAKHINPELQLRRSVMAHMLWEAEFYEDGHTIAGRIASLVAQCKPEAVAAMAIEAREKMKLRHVPLLIVREMARLATHRSLVSTTLATVIQRPDELAEFVAIYWKDKKQPLSAQVKRGLAMLLRELCADVAVVTFSTNAVLVPSRRGFALRDAIDKSQEHGGTNLGASLIAVHASALTKGYDRLIVITDEQSSDTVSDPRGLGYVINVASAKNGIGYGKWMHIDGWSEAVVDYIMQHEKAR